MSEESKETNKQQDQQSNSKICPYCKESVAIDAIKCPHCQSTISTFHRRVYAVLAGIAMFFVIICLGYCSNKDIVPPIYANRVLVVNILKGEESSSFSSTAISTALKKGGQINISVNDARQIFTDFDNNFSVSDNDGNFATYGTLLNFIASQGWKIEYSEGMVVVFSKTSFIGF